VKFKIYSRVGSTYMIVHPVSSLNEIFKHSGNYNELSMNTLYDESLKQQNPHTVDERSFFRYAITINDTKSIVVE
jgi:hypothetical protein